MVTDFQAYLLEKGLQRLEEFLVAHRAAQHLHHDRAFVGAERPVFGRIIFEPRGLNQRNVVDRQRRDAQIFHPLFESGRAFFFFGPEGFGIERHAVFQPQMVAVDGRNLDFPPLPRDLIGQNVGVHLLCRSPAEK